LLISSAKSAKSRKKLAADGMLYCAVFGERGDFTDLMGRAAGMHRAGIPLLSKSRAEARDVSRRAFVV
jgi:hypothetical protein